MVININLSSPEVAEKKSLTGKSALILSILLLFLVAAAYTAVVFLKGRYVNQGKAIDAAIDEKKSEINGTAFSEVIYFQEKLNLLEKVADDHPYWDGLLVKMGSYVVPEVRFNKFSGKRDEAGGGLIEISGTAVSLDALARELILLKSFPGIDSFEFKNAEQGMGQQAGISFAASLKINKSLFQK